LVCNFAIPFFGLLSRHAKRSRKILAFFAIWILSFHYLDLYWLIFPNGGGEAPFAPTQILFLVGVLAVFFGVVARRAKGVNLVPTNDPRLADSLAFENY
jgi:hypothetical protein